MMYDPRSPYETEYDASPYTDGAAEPRTTADALAFDALPTDSSASGGPLKSVNWITGMLLTPQHFERQDRFVEEAARWAVRFALPHTGLLGAGLRTDTATREPARDDPRIAVHDDGTTLRLTLLAARGVTPSGDVVDVIPADAVQTAVPRSALAGLTEAELHVVRYDGREEDPGSRGLDPVNAQQAALRRPRYRLMLGADAEVRRHALAVGRVRRGSETLGFSLDTSYIPPCAAVMAHSLLYDGWARLREGVSQLAERYGELHRAVAAYAERLAERGVDVRGDLDTLAFVERAVLALDDCAYALVDPARAPGPVFGEVERMGRRVALALDLSAATRLFLHAIAPADAGYEVLLEEERQALARRRGTAAEEAEREGDLAHALARAEETLRRVRELGAAVEGKYLDYRLNRAVDALRFLLDRGGEGFYTAVATPGHPRRDGDLLTFDFSSLQLPSRQEYRVLLVGDAGGPSAWQVGDTVAVDVRVNPAGGGTRPISQMLRCEVAGQRNFAVTFDVPGDVGSLTALRVTVQEQGHRIRRAALYQRGRGVIADVPVVAVASASPTAAPAYLPAAYSAQTAAALGSVPGENGTYNAGGPATATPVPGTSVTPVGPAGPVAPAQTTPQPVAPSYARDVDYEGQGGTGAPVTGTPAPPVPGTPVIKRIPLRRPGS